MKVALYARVSKDEKADDHRFQNPENQLEPLRKYAESFGYEVVAEYVDKCSGANANRPQFRKLLQNAMLRRFVGIIVWKLDRFSREGIIPTMSYIKRLRERQCWLKSMTETWVDTKDEGITELVMSVMAWSSAEERRKISERTKAGIQRLKKRGKWKGGRPRLKNK
ncbi:MAG: recombinase family protein [Candidatus Micrarchaeia archaeon]